MDFRFDNQPPPAVSSSSICSSTSDPRLRELVERRVKEEMKIKEMAWRRTVEAEIRREIIMEQELAILRLRATERSLNDEQFSMKSWEQRMLNHSNLSPRKEPTDDHQKQILLPRPNPRQFEAKRKAVSPAIEAVDEAAEPEPPFGWTLKKAKKEEEKFFCKTSATSQTSLDEHLGGKKHLAKSEEKTATTMEEEEEEEEGKLKEQPSPENKGLFKFWCQICQIGTQNVVVMENHKMGKKHKSRLLKLAWEQHNMNQIPSPN